MSRYVGSVGVVPSQYPFACVSFSQVKAEPARTSIFGGSCAPKLPAEPLTQTPRAARRLHVFSPLAQTICPESVLQSSGKASALAIHSARGSAAGFTGIASRVNQSASDKLNGHSWSFATFGGRAFDALSEQLSRTFPSSVRPRRKVTSPKGRRRTVAPIFW